MKYAIQNTSGQWWTGDCWGVEQARVTDLVKICAHCKRRRLDDGTWVKEPEGTEHTNASHGICPDCFEEKYGKDELSEGE